MWHVIVCSAREIVINDVKYSTFLLLLQYIYCDQVDIAVETAMDLFQVCPAPRCCVWPKQVLL